MRILLTLTLFAFPLHAQLAFEVASIKPAPPQPMGSVSISRRTDQGRLTYSNVSLADMIQSAWRIPHGQISGPDWMDSIRFDIAAKFPEGVDEKKAPEMLQTLLKERFALKLHEETKELPIYALVVSKNGPKLTKLEGENFGMSTNASNLKNHLSAKTNMPEFAEYLSGRLDRPVRDRTGIEGGWQFELEWAADKAPESDSPSLFTALQEQLGLKLTPSKGPVRLIVVDSIAKAPVDN
jgi:uncharacterized protein (TIGR03435 family)